MHTFLAISVPIPIFSPTPIPISTSVAIALIHLSTLLPCHEGLKGGRAGMDGKPPGDRALKAWADGVPTPVCCLRPCPEEQEQQEPGWMAARRVCGFSCGHECTEIHDVYPSSWFSTRI